MNLFFNTSVNEFSKLIRKAINDKAAHEVVIDYDGEVLIDPQLEQPELDLDKFKVHVHVSDTIKNDIVRKPNTLSKFFLSIIEAWNNPNHTGRIAA